MAGFSRPRRSVVAPIIAASLAGLLWLGCSSDQKDLTAPDDQIANPLQGLRPAIDVQVRHTDRLLAIPGVVGTAVGLDEDGAPTIRLFTEEAGIAGLPESLEGVPVAVVVTGRFVAFANPAVDPTARFSRPVPTGVSTGHPAITAGTIGARVRDAAGNVYALSNNHVYANQNDASIGDGALQPGAFDGGSDPADRIGTLFDYEPIRFAKRRRVPNNIMDAAIALSSTGMLGYATPSDGYGAPSAITVAPFIGQSVQKYGRTTGLTQGTVSEVSVTVDVCYAGVIICTQWARFSNQFAVIPGTFSGGGDSGSFIVTAANKYGVGLLFAGSSTHTIGSPIGPILQRFNVTIDDGSGGGPPGNVPPTASFTYSCSGLACDLNASGSFDSDGNITSYDWTFGDGNAGSDVTPSHTYASAGTYTVTLTVTDDENAQGSSSQDVTVTVPGAAGTMHVGDLWQLSSSEGKTWSAIVAVTVHDSDHNLVNLATVTGNWSDGVYVVDECETTAGDCLVFSTLIRKRVGSVTFTMADITYATVTYAAGDNHDANGDSDGTTITVSKP